MYPEDEWNFETLIDMINNSECREDDEEFKNSIDLEFEIVECWLNGTKHDDPDVMEDYADLFETKPDAEQRRMGAFALKQFKAYKLAAGKTAKSILISCSTRLAPFAIDEVLEITSYDELHLDKLGDELSALFIIISDTDATFNFLVAIMYSQLFNLLCTKADNSPGGKLDYHVRCLLDEFANIGEIPQFEKLIATIRSREISASIILQAKSQLKAIYKDNADTIEGNCDTMLFLGGKEKSTLKEISESLGKETIDSFNTSTNRGQSESYGMNYQKLGKELKSQDELAVMDGGKCILQVRGVRPFFSDKFDITRHKQYFSITAVIDGEEFNYDGRFDIGDGKGTGGGSLIDHIRTYNEGILGYTQHPFNQPEYKERAQRMLDIFVPFLEAHSELTAEEQRIFDDFKAQHPIRTYDDVEKAQGTFKIYQLPGGEKYHGIRFESIDRLKADGVQLNKDDYELMYEGEVGEFRGNATLL